MGMMKGYWAIFSARFRTLLQYRAAALAGLGTQVFWGWIRVMVFYAFYQSSTASQPMTYDQVVTFIWLGQATILLLICGADGDVTAMIRSGTVAYEMLRPMDVYSLWYARAVAARTAPVLMRAIPIFVLAGLFFGLHPPASFASGCLWAASTLGSVLLASALGTLMTVTMLWTLAGDGISRLTYSAVYILSGSIIPLPFFPSWMQPVLNFLPFRGMADVPFRLYSGNIPASAGLVPVAQQFLWTLILIAFGRWLLARGTRRLVVQGG
jgi:ABC-2 type transport system permease protein